MSPGEIDSRVIRRHLLALDEAIRVLERHAGRSVESLRQDPEERWAVERGLQLCAQNALDIATHLAAGHGHDVPDYASAIDTLAEIKAVPREFAARFRSVAGFRNILVHGYLAIDVEIVHQVLNDRVGEFTEFARYVEKFLERR